MKVRLTQPGFENYTGQMGVIQFVDGVSIDHVSYMDARRMSAVMSCESVDGESISLAQDLINKNDNAAPVVAELPREGENEIPVVASLEAATEASESANTLQDEIVELVDAAEDVSIPPKKKFTKAELEAIADKEGIKGLRAIAEPYGIKNNSINGLITEMIRDGVATAE